ncbi:hypothetical protein A2716_00730 [candidate division WWE3 bacterium RIFCSPHIGHO2_01_FULL_40_23]|uniref:Uncharacterized protein n=1 Tax=candidate division WWE3 bacterium RIFCSPLOWO2_01_FULL_41_18 TaxID=1802625 RepID=A0A1F4VED8_UNCKA|nr:MAG: hypothetical protein A2716_00730 [candidate division WWE3 bacterium RIFCSPHIGHO2_01_FULL_40_23]OGC55519.1 MAG: hypothetical protein A3A78_01000 [candidate division WWE3 bacterium RIFCSPLOWO2_01_FULL_41_18]
MPGGGRGRAFNIRMAGDNTTVRPQIPRFAQDDTINLQEAERLGIKIVDRGSTCLVKVGEDPNALEYEVYEDRKKSRFLMSVRITPLVCPYTGLPMQSFFENILLE